ncbi:MAG TPA: hypothetical protein PK163_10980, partial [Steroidobacteraceae bacterium]|nr:hypothetical protein [Steroidobacteraceae bacterium]
MASDRDNAAGRKIWIIAGLVAVAGIIGYVSLDYPPASDSAAGTIVPAQRYRADGAGGAPMGDQSGLTSQGSDSSAASAANAANA